MLTNEGGHVAVPSPPLSRATLLGLLPLMVLAAGWAAGGRQRPATLPSINYGDAVRVGEGEARTYWVTTDTVPDEIGVVLSADALKGLPDGRETFEYVLPLPAHAAAKLPFRDVVLNWNPHGHVPSGVYDVPHFDFHFYTITDGERRQIDADDPEFTSKGTRQPAAELIPAGYVLPEGTLEPRMGAHWIDPKAPEFNGKPFTRTFIFGSWDGHITFYEPMITLAYLETHPDVTQPVPVAGRHDVPGHYPGAYRVSYDAGTREFRIGLMGLEATRP